MLRPRTLDHETAAARGRRAFRADHGSSSASRWASSTEPTEPRTSVCGSFDYTRWAIGAVPSHVLYEMDVVGLGYWCGSCGGEKRSVRDLVNGRQKLSDSGCRRRRWRQRARADSSHRSPTSTAWLSTRGHGSRASDADFNLPGQDCVVQGEEGGMGHGAAGSFEEYATSQWHRLVRFGFLLCGDWGAAEDVVQDALVSAHRHWPRVREMDSPDAYIAEPFSIDT